MKVQRLSATTLLPKATKVGYTLIGTEVKKLYPVNHIDLEGEAINSRFESLGRFYLDGGERVLIGTGLKFKPDEGDRLQLQSVQEQMMVGLIVLNLEIPVGYEGELCVIVLNVSGKRQWIELGRPVANLVRVSISNKEEPLIEESFEDSTKIDSFGLIKVKKEEMKKVKVNVPLMPNL